VTSARNGRSHPGADVDSDHNQVVDRLSNASNSAVQEVLEQRKNRLLSLQPLNIDVLLLKKCFRHLSRE